MDEPPTVFLINDHYRKMGCFSWDRTRFLRLASACSVTQNELGARVGLDARQVSRNLESSRFPRSTGILLSQLERYIRHALTGYEDKQDLFPPLR